MLTKDNLFLLDNRQLVARLQLVQHYWQKIPFGDSGKNWADVVFNHGNSPAVLAEHFLNPETGVRNLPPQQAFLLAFMKMLDTPVRLLNKLPERHRDLYYRGELGLELAPAQPDTMLVTFELDEAYPDYYLPEGTLINAGQDGNGVIRQYHLQQSIFLNHTRLSDIRWVGPRSGGEAHYVHTALDDVDGIKFPENGVRLFKPLEEQSQLCRHGLLLPFSALNMAGERRVLTLTFSDALPEGVEVALSVENGWKPLVMTDKGNREFECEIDYSTVPAPQEEGYALAGPLIRILSTLSYPLPLVKAVALEVYGVTDAEIRVDNGEMSAQESSYPFGVDPVPGAQFKVMSPTWCNIGSGTLDITLMPQWAGLPADMADWYGDYDAAITDESFTATVTGSQVIEDRPWVFFNSSSAYATRPQAEKLKTNQSQFSMRSPQIDPENRVLYWRMAPCVVLGETDFQHTKYRQLTAQGKMPKNLPYDPRFQQLVVNCSVSLTDEEEITQYALTPFGYRLAGEPEDNFPALYCGLRDIEPGQQLTLYWDLSTPRQFLADKIGWFYLAQRESGTGEWKPLETMRDSLDSFSQSGIWSTTIPDDASLTTTLMPQGRLWLKVEGFEFIDEVPDSHLTENYPLLKGLYANAGTARLANAERLEESHFAGALPAGSVDGLAEPLEAIASVSQPIPSWGAMPAESNQAFYQRVATRLSHRGRASSWRDIIAIILERFPEVHHIRLPGIENLDGLYKPPEEEDGSHTRNAHLRYKKRVYDDQSREHMQTLMVIPRAGYSDSVEPLRPMFNPSRLKEIQQYIMERASPWLNLTVVNPEYIEVKISYNVAWMPGVNIAECVRMLNDVIKKYFMPWQDANSIVELATSLSIFDVMSVIQRQTYVKHVHTILLNGSPEAINTVLSVILVSPEYDVELSPLADSTGGCDE
ncbi:hypothetical protein [Enterobacter bugandensis]|uniref:hypothetical protein n=1 Tax=Enterobacter bugandensis TaxID=881260 RepID=UPI002FCED83A